LVGDNNNTAGHTKCFTMSGVADNKKKNLPCNKNIVGVELLLYAKGLPDGI
jgi:hypothetical protein